MPNDAPPVMRHGSVAVRLVKPRDARVLQRELLMNRPWLQKRWHRA